MPTPLKTPIFAAAILLLASAATPSKAHALDEIYSPIAEFHEWALEYSGSHSFDSNNSRNNAQDNEFALEAGITPRITMEMSGIFERDPGGTSQFNATELEGRYQFFEQGENWLDSGLLVAYDQAAHQGDANSLEVKLLLQKDIGRITTTANIGFEQELGNNATGGPDYVFLANTRYRYSYYFEPGIEIQSDLGQDGEIRHFNDQQQFIGPALYGHVFPHLRYQAAWLAGVTENSATSAARLLLEYEMHF